MLIKIYILSIILFLVFGELATLRAKSVLGEKNKKKKRTMLENFITFIRNLGLSMIPVINTTFAITFAVLFFFASDEWYKDALGEDKEC
ncbi:MAG: hypothetical protein E7I47_10700 [Clostridium sp.]|uniref:hypothetical protein n=1 Tax=Clostridium sp. TaxID=1506 RepID=UPI00290CF50B|nr:hypothetical protein [Clostridium sp.]MDU4319767.1 hypothetical protein [Clostridium sp.]